MSTEKTNDDTDLGFDNLLCIGGCMNGRKLKVPAGTQYYKVFDMEARYNYSAIDPAIESELETTYYARHRIRGSEKIYEIFKEQSLSGDQVIEKLLHQYWLE